MKPATIIKRILDLALTVTLLLLMAFQITEQTAHEWLGISMVALTILHQILNRKYYAAIFRGKYPPLRVLQTAVNTLLMLSFLCTALSGMMMSRYATPFLNGLISTSLIRQGHLAMSHWSFVLMGVHLGLHFSIISGKIKKTSLKIAAGILMGGISVYGFYLFFRANMLDYMLWKAPFAFLDYSKAWWSVLLENLAMLLSWAFAAYLLSILLRVITRKTKNKGERKDA